MAKFGGNDFDLHTDSETVPMEVSFVLHTDSKTVVNVTFRDATTDHSLYLLALIPESNYTEFAHMSNEQALENFQCIVGTLGSNLTQRTYNVQASDGAKLLLTSNVLSAWLLYPAMD